MDYLKELKQDTLNIDDLIIKEIKIKKNKVVIISIETITNTKRINEFILKELNNINNNHLYEYLYYNLPCLSIKLINNYQDLLKYLFNGYTILLVKEKVLGIETNEMLSRSITTSDYEKTITGPKDSFIEQFNTNVGLIRRRIKNNNLKLETINIGKYTNTKIGVMYIKKITKEKLKSNVLEKLQKINIDGIIDSAYLIRYLSQSKSVFPTIKKTERPDLVSQALLEGKIVLIIDNSPDILILPTFFIDYFHTSDDYYQKSINITFIRLIRFLAFIISIILPSYYIAITTYNVDFIPINLLINFISQRQSVPSPGFIEALVMLISFEILRESDTRIPSNMGTSISILGGLILGDTLVSAGIISPIMIVVIAISMISSLVFQNMEMINAIRSFRFILIILSSLLGLYGIFIGTILIILNLADTKSLDKDYLYPFAPINLDEQKDGFIKLKNKILKRNPLLSNNQIRGR